MRRKVVGIRKAAITTTDTRPMVRGDQNSPAWATGVELGLKVGYNHVSPVGVAPCPGEVPGDDVGPEEDEDVGCGGVVVGVGVEDFEVTVNVAVAEPPEASVAVTVYVPGETDGTVNPELNLPNIWPTYAFATSASPNLIVAWVFELYPIPITDTNVPAGP